MDAPTILPLKRRCPIEIDEEFHGDLFVESGSVWLTTFPTAGDIVLRAGDRQRIIRMAGAIVQAVGADACLHLLPSHSASAGCEDAGRP